MPPSNNEKKLPNDPNNSFGAYIFKKKLSDSCRNEVFLIESKTGKRVTYGELVDQSHSLAMAMLHLMAFQQDDICAIMSESSIHYAVTIGACLLLNVTYSSVAPAFGSFTLGQQLVSTKAKCLFISRELYPKLEQMYASTQFAHLIDELRVIIMDHDLSDNPLREECTTVQKLISAFQGNEEHRIEQIPYFWRSVEDIVTIVYTSGSTGFPKGACHTHRSIMADIEQLIEHNSLKRYHGQTMLLSFPIGHISGNIVLFKAMASRTPVVLINYKEIEQGDLLPTIQKHQIGQIYGASSVINLVANNQHAHNISSLKMVLASGTKLPLNTGQLLREKQVTVLQSYGSTETLYVTNSDEDDERLDHVGKPLPNMQMKIIDINNQLILPDGQVGEICIRGPLLFKHYYQNEEETKKAMDKDGWYHTGDLGHFDQDGHLYITDRIKEIIKFKAYSVFPVDIECLLMTHEAVKEAVVVPVKHSSYYEVPRAYIVLKDGHQLTTQQLHQYTKEYFGFHQRVRGGIVIMDQLKYTAMGKIDRQYFKKLCANELLHSTEEFA